MKIEGVPEGWELVRIGFMKKDDWAIGGDGTPFQYIKEKTGNEFWPIIRKVKPVCVWPHGVFRDGWIAEQHEGGPHWFSKKPWWNSEENYWDYVSTTVRTCDHLANGPVFRSDLRRDERIQKVGPTIEATLKGGGA